MFLVLIALFVAQLVAQSVPALSDPSIFTVASSIPEGLTSIPISDGLTSIPITDGLTSIPISDDASSQAAASTTVFGVITSIPISEESSLASSVPDTFSSNPTEAPISTTIDSAAVGSDVPTAAPSTSSSSSSVIAAGIIPEVSDVSTNSDASASTVIPIPPPANPTPDDPVTTPISRPAPSDPNAPTDPTDPTDPIDPPTPSNPTNPTDPTDPTDSNASTPTPPGTDTSPTASQMSSAEAITHSSSQASDSITSTTSSDQASCTIWDISPLPGECQSTNDDDGDCDEIDSTFNSAASPQLLRRGTLDETKRIAGRIKYVTTPVASMNHLITPAPQPTANFVNVVQVKPGNRRITAAGSCPLRSTFKENPYPRVTDFNLPDFQSASRFFPISLSSLPPLVPGQQGPGCVIPVMISTSDLSGISTVPGGPTYQIESTLAPPPTPWVNSDHVFELSLLSEFFKDRLDVDPNKPSCNDFSNMFEVNNRLKNIWAYMPGDVHPDFAAMDQVINLAKADFFNTNQGSFAAGASLAAQTNSVIRHGLAAAAINHPNFIALFQRTHQRMYDAFQGIDATIQACGVQAPAPTWASAYSAFVTSWLSDAGNRASSRASEVYSLIAAGGGTTTDFVRVYPPASFMLSSVAMASLNLNNPPAPVKRDASLCPNTAAATSAAAAATTQLPSIDASPTAAASDSVFIPTVTPGAPLKLTGLPSDLTGLPGETASPVTSTPDSTLRGCVIGIACVVPP